MVTTNSLNQTSIYKSVTNVTGLMLGGMWILNNVFLSKSYLEYPLIVINLYLGEQ